jgi:hypothetical protein
VITPDGVKEIGPLPRGGLEMKACHLAQDTGYEVMIMNGANPELILTPKAEGLVVEDCKRSVAGLIPWIRIFQEETDD